MQPPSLLHLFFAAPSPLSVNVICPLYRSNYPLYFGVPLPVRMSYANGPHQDIGHQVELQQECHPAPLHRRHVRIEGKE